VYVFKIKIKKKEKEKEKRKLGHHNPYALVWLIEGLIISPIDWCRTEFNNIFGANENRTVAKNNIEAEPFD